jgi:hypothetical protein
MYCPEITFSPAALIAAATSAGEYGLRPAGWTVSRQPEFAVERW